MLLLAVAPSGSLHAQGADSAGVAPGRDTVVVVAPDARPGGPGVLGDGLLLARSAAHSVTAPARWGADDLRSLGLTAGGIAVVSLLDEHGRELMAQSQGGAGDWLEDVVEPFGRERGLQLLGGMYLAGLVLDDRKLRAVATEGAASGLVAAGLIQPALARITGRARPRRELPAYTFRPFSGNISFPSGHTTGAFSVASVIAAEYPHPAVQAATYGLASAVGLARMYRGAHFLSDVVAAGALGTVVGRAVARFGRDQRGRISVEPAVAGGEAYLVLGIPLP